METLGKKVAEFQEKFGNCQDVWSDLNICNSTSLIDGSMCLQQTVLQEEEDGTHTVLGRKVYSVRVVDEWVEYGGR
jgi:hypothetical protein